MFIDTLILILKIHSFILSARNGALRLLLVFKRKQSGGKDILRRRSLPMDSTSSDLPLFRTIERQGFYDEWKELKPMALRSQYDIKTLTAVACRLAAESSSRALGLRLRVFPNILLFWNEKLTTALAPRSKFAFARYLFILTKKSFFCRVRSPPENYPYLSPDESFVSNEIFIPHSGSLIRGVGSSIKAEYTRFIVVYSEQRGARQAEELKQLQH